MIALSPEFTSIGMFVSLIIGVLLGYPLSMVLSGIGLFFGLAVLGTGVFGILLGKTFGLLINYTFLAVPLFVFMGSMVEASGIAEKMYAALEESLGQLKGGLAVATLVLATIMAACVGVIAASVTMVGLIAIPSMLKRNYNKELICGTVCAGGSLGILIPPSVMIVIYGPTAGISVGKLFMAAFIPGVILSILYIVYVLVRCRIQPELAPVYKNDIVLSWSQKMKMLLTSLVPPVALILGVLGVIFFGIAPPTEAAAVGALVSVLLTAAYRKLNFGLIKKVAISTAKLTSMVMLIAIGAAIFTGVFLRLGGGRVIANILLAMPFGKWGVFAFIMFLVFILGMFIDWIGIIFIIVPLITPIVKTLGFDPLWFAMTVMVCLQFSFITPPFAYSIFFLKALVKPEWGITTGHIVRGVLPFIVLIAVGLWLIVQFPQLVLWLPNVMIK